MRIKKFFTFIFLIIAMMSSASPSEDYLKKDQLFTAARKLLIKNKWVPVKIHAEQNYEYVGLEKDLITLNILEVDSCSIDSSRCIFYYRKNNQCLRLDTIGEQSKYMKVVQWSDECPEVPLEPTGIYSNLVQSKESGDMSGVELMIIPANAGDAPYSVFIQDAEGGAPFTAIVPLNIDNSKILFDFPALSPRPNEHVEGVFVGNELVIHWSDGNEEHLRRGKSFWQKSRY